MTEPSSLLELDKYRQRVRQLRWYVAFITLLLIIAALLLKIIFFDVSTGVTDCRYIGYWVAVAFLSSLSIVHVLQRSLPRQRLTEAGLFFIGYVALLYFYWVDLHFGSEIYIQAGTQADSSVGTVVWLALLYLGPFTVWSLRTALTLAIGTHMSIVSLWLFYVFVLRYTPSNVFQGDIVHIAIAGTVIIFLSTLLKQMTLISARERTMVEYALKDSLTALPNRLYIDEFLRTNFSCYHQQQRPIAFALCDIDRFKRVNDRFSHAVGDKTLQAFAKLIQANLSTDQIFGRYGGEEFIFIFLDKTQQEAAQLCEVLRAKIAAYDWQSLHQELAITASFGVSDNTNLSDDACFERVLHHADSKLYEAKNSGRNRVCV